MIENTNIFQPLYRQLLFTVPHDYEESIYPFFVQAGKNFATTFNRCLFVGKSVNGWITNSSDVDELFNPENDDRIVNRDNQMEWVNEYEGRHDVYNTRKSAFWRVIKAISKSFYNVEDWYNYVAWSNLYKLSPKSGNPRLWLQKIQRNMCVKILSEEIRVLDPHYIIFLTSSWEQFYFDSIGIDQEKSLKVSWSNYKTYYQSYHNRVFIQSMHPQGKKEKAHTEAILEIMQRTL